MVAGTGSTTTHEAEMFRIHRTHELAEEQRKYHERAGIGGLRRYVPIILHPTTSTDPRQRPSQQFASPVPQLLRTYQSRPRRFKHRRQCSRARRVNQGRNTLPHRGALQAHDTRYPGRCRRRCRCAGRVPRSGTLRWARDASDEGARVQREVAPHLRKEHDQIGCPRVGEGGACERSLM